MDRISIERRTPVRGNRYSVRGGGGGREEEKEEEVHRRLLSLILMSTEKRHLKELSLMSSHLHADTRKTGYIKKKKPSTLPAAHTNIIDI